MHLKQLLGGIALSSTLAAGAVSGAVDQQQNKEAIIRNCMRGRGYNVVG